MLNRILLGAAISWGFSVTLGLLFAACVSGKPFFSTLRLPGVVPVALIISTAVSLVITPITAWSVRTGARNLRLYAPILWVVLGAYIVLVIPKVGRYGPLGLLSLGVIGLVALGFVPTAAPALESNHS
jgi:hypothetical protein